MLSSLTNPTTWSTHWGSRGLARSASLVWPRRSPTRSTMQPASGCGICQFRSKSFGANVDKTAAEGEVENPCAGIKKSDLELAFSNRPGLPDQLIEPRHG